MSLHLPSLPRRTPRRRRFPCRYSNDNGPLQSLLDTCLARPFVGYFVEVHSWMFDLDYIHILLRNLSCEQNTYKAGILAREVCFMLQSNAGEATGPVQGSA